MLQSNKLERLINGIYPSRSGDIFITLKPGYMEWSSKTGTTHGTHFNYDSHVPLIFYGFNIKFSTKFTETLILLILHLLYPYFIKVRFLTHALVILLEKSLINILCDLSIYINILLFYF